MLLYTLAGGIIGYYAGVYASCLLLWPGLNLCGLPGVFLTGPLGLVIGLALGMREKRTALTESDAP